jgi:hypothetical protein
LTTARGEGMIMFRSRAPLPAPLRGSRVVRFSQSLL